MIGLRHLLTRVATMLAVCAGLALTGCATASPASGAKPDPDDPSVIDPLEPLNRAIFGFNDALDGAILKPVARGYQTVVPVLLRDGIANFFANLADLWTSANQMLQGKPSEGVSDLARFAINSTLGLGGLVDLASPMGLERHEEDLGQTLGVWGVPSGPYLVLPFFGPSSFRDGPTRVVEIFLDPVDYIGPRREVVALWLTRAVDGRARLFAAEKVLEGAALDKYSFVRDSWLQRRRNQIYDGNPPLPPEED